MFTFIKEQLTSTEMVLIFSGLLVIASTVYLTLEGSLAISHIAKAIYVIGVVLLIRET
jgi:hypothetical protein